MKPIDQYAALSNFTTDLDQHGPLIPFKIMGKRRLPNSQGKGSSFFSVSMLTEVHRQTDDPDSVGPYQTVPAPFGEILARGARLFADRTYSKITAHPMGANHFQGDVIELDISDGGQRHPRHRFSMLLSHTCDIQKLSHVTVVPAFLESEMTVQAITDLREGKSPGNQKQALQLLEQWLSNEIAVYVGLPPTDHAGVPAGERILVCLHLGVPIPRKEVLARPTQLRLKYRASSYLQGRLAVLLIRDVQDSDETREV